MEKANQQTMILEKELAIMETRLNDTMARLERHLDHYTTNGRELAALKVSVDNLSTLVEKQASRDKEGFTDIWVQTRQNSVDIAGINVTLGKLIVRVSFLAATAAAVASTASSVVISLIF